MSTKTDLWSAYLQARGEYDAQKLVLERMENLKTQVNNTIVYLENAIKYYDNSNELYEIAYKGGAESRSKLTKEKLTENRGKLDTVKTNLITQVSSIETAITTQSGQVEQLRMRWEGLFNAWQQTPEETPAPTPTPTSSTPSGGSSNVPPPSGRGRGGGGGGAKPNLMMKE